jgi:hypothetical protein
MTYVASRVDGRILFCRDGSIRVLSLSEKFQYLIGWKDASALDKVPYPVIDNSDLRELLTKATKIANGN